MSTNSLDVTAIDGEPRVRDVDLATRLGFDRPRKIRDLIKRYSAELDRMGPRPTVGRVINGGAAMEFYLNRKQAIFVTAKSDTETATDVTIAIIERFDAYERGARRIVTPAEALTEFLADPAKVRTLLLGFTEQVVALKDEVADLAPKAEVYDRISHPKRGTATRSPAKMLERIKTGGRTAVHTTPGTGKQPKDRALAERIGRRLFAARMAYNENQSEVAMQLGVSSQVMSAAELGRNFPDEMLVIRFCLVTGCPADWIYLGRLQSQMPVKMAAKLGSTFSHLLEEEGVERAASAGK